MKKKINKTLIPFIKHLENKGYTVEKGQRLFQLVAADSSTIEYELVEEIEMTTRGIGGFGSTGA